MKVGPWNGNERERKSGMVRLESSWELLGTGATVDTDVNDLL